MNNYRVIAIDINDDIERQLEDSMQTLLVEQRDRGIKPKEMRQTNKFVEYLRFVDAEHAGATLNEMYDGIIGGKLKNEEAREEARRQLKNAHSAMEKIINSR